MVECKGCGFLAVWIPKPGHFEEASTEFREMGKPDGAHNDAYLFKPKCFILKHDLAKELDGTKAARLGDVMGYNGKVLEIIRAPRLCDGYFPWIQGFHPKEHSEMIDRRAERKWRIAEGLIFALAGGLVALFAQWVANPPVVTVAPPVVNITTPPVNVTVQTPDTKPSTAVQLSPPKTKHDPQPLPPSPE